MDTRQTRRKRRNSSISGPEAASPASCRKTRQSESHAASASPYETPRRSSKRVRFSDPGNQRQHGLDRSTGLTPAMRRTSFQVPTDVDSVTRTPSRSLRQRSAPIPRSRRSPQSTLDAGTPFSERIVQFTPLRQILDARTQRRIRRVGLSDEITQLEREKRESYQNHKTLQSLLRERDSLRQELETVKRSRSLSESQSINDETTWMSPQSLLEHVESENGRLKEQLSIPSPDTHHDSCTTTNSEEETMIIADSGWECDTVLISDSPDIRGLSQRQLPVPEELSLLGHGFNNADASTQVSISSHDRDTDIATLSADLEAARKEKRDLFDACRARIASFGGTAIDPHLRQSSPPPDFLDQILPTLTQTLSRASDAAQSLNSIKEELSGLGFPGDDATEIVSTMRDRFRSARLELERAVPGETANASLNDGDATLGALVKRVEMLVKSLGDEQARLEGSVGRENAIRGQFDSLLGRYETASKKIHDLEDSIATSAGDMLHTRMRMHELEDEGKEHAVSIERLNTALNKYREEVKGLEALVMQLEEDRTKSHEGHKQRVEELQLEVDEHERARHAAESTVAERETRIRELEAIVEENRIRVRDLIANAESIEMERQQAIQRLEREAAEQQQHHEQEAGSMNVLVSELNTSLDEARSDIERLRRSNTDLESQLRLELEARDNLLDKWAADQARSFAFMKETVNSERRKAKVRTANWQLKSDELRSDSTINGSSPITPVNMTRFVDVEVGRGKQRKRLDSGIGILTDDLEDIDDLPETILPSDPADL
ncbi:hypothetical protein BO70DRAFT_358669 [Aspergillus heteromorphus CBS 117.55]|uniref:Uncharacterized protein n=1 Tax=Aspergillus heteromorphus CBS 117.55 TaxID=1448321 RepID=A0A317WXT7_9EURO|nr:uncharacterized protein BO70DRAFT_358669 [Aspergillus heteromorphus CBS 117.55]PWY91224.1 hypothetical protein BO70DRAFT_358669 [Aspergillus heteromorphus CBS 117.55]